MKPENVSRRASGSDPRTKGAEETTLATGPEKSEESEKSHKRVAIRWGIFAVVCIALICVVMFFSSRLDSTPTYSGGKVVGKLVPDVTVKTLDGQEIALRSLSGKRVIVNFFNSWCVPCQEEEPALQEFAQNHKDDPDFVFIGIARDDSDKNIRAWAKSRDVPFETTLDPGNAASIAFGTTGQPETYAINANGQVVGSLLSRASADTLEEMWNATQ